MSTAESDQGDFVNYEVDCLAQLLPQERTPETCRVYVLSDRQMTLDRLTSWVREHQCTPITQPHDLRHSAASYLAMNGASLAEISEILGHKTLQMVKRYAHLSESHTSNVVASMNEKIFSSIND